MSLAYALEQPVIRMGSLDPQRDMTFVRDTALGFIAAGTAPGVEGETINLGVGRTDSIGAIAHRILELMDSKKNIEQDAARLRPSKSEVMRLLSDNSKARDLLGWSPTVTLDEGLQETIEFVQRHLPLYKTATYAV
ncbi:GDP-mannose 4,6-dehydratase [Desulfovibrio intestinalis]|uniref:Nucleoside-diphosphate-sugar epimerase n=1 Tax=Desulfovibrio intestinalis TaxID=58621 RepID=A0A7W8C5I9_9BACT|nr:GDP-mannose 4,6-dehydratase [Desulfovibrio intestinalis]MBB5144789.1 nucleoside-diphosphate-sugar epimerase [Desulfovibrio intestinalis]